MNIWQGFYVVDSKRGWPLCCVWGFLLVQVQSLLTKLFNQSLGVHISFRWQQFIVMLLMRGKSEMLGKEKKRKKGGCCYLLHQKI